MGEGFSFPKLDMPDKNPLLAKATVTDSSGRGAAAKPLQPRDSQVKLVQDTIMPPPQGRPGKVALGHGCSQLDWMRLQKSGKDLSGLKGQKLRRDITMEEVKQHSSKEDAWTVMHGKVYNITPYMKFHPGGIAQLRRGAGIDSTALFNKYHSWVNADMMLGKCLIGLLVRSKPEEGLLAKAPQAS